jgi:xanthine/CO dehydrogenase XdhC/CoxF family maturation factor
VLLWSVRGSDDLDKADLDTAVEFVAERESPRATGFPGATAIRRTLQLGQARLFVSHSTETRRRLEVLVEPLIPNPVLLIAGGGHVGQAVAAQAVLVGFEVVVVDDRPDFADRSLFPDGVAARCAAMEEEVARFPLDADTYVVIVTRDHGHDARVLAACLKRPAAYVGMIGSRRKVALVRQGLVESGRFTAEEFARLHAPIGLDIGAVTVPEIAASIVSELIAVRRRGGSSGLSMRAEQKGSPA